jgi:hypothetical protein
LKIFGNTASQRLFLPRQYGVTADFAGALEQAVPVDGIWEYTLDASVAVATYSFDGSHI